MNACMGNESGIFVINNKNFSFFLLAELVFFFYIWKWELKHVHRERKKPGNSRRTSAERTPNLRYVQLITLLISFFDVSSASDVNDVRSVCLFIADVMIWHLSSMGKPAAWSDSNATVWLNPTKNTLECGLLSSLLEFYWLSVNGFDATCY